RDRPPDPAVRDARPREPAGRSPGRVRDQLPGLDDVRGRGRGRHCQHRRDPPEDRVRDRRPCRRTDPAATRSRRQDLRRLRLSERGPDPQVRDQGRWGQGRVQDGHARLGRLRGPLQPPGRFHDPVHRLGGRRSGAARNQAALLPVRRLRLSGVLPGRPRLRPAVARQEPGRREAVRHGHRQGLPVRRRQRRRGRRDPRVREPGRVRCEQGPAEGEPGVPRPGPLPRRCRRRLRDADPRALDRLLEVPVRPGPARRARPEAAGDASRLREAVHERLPAVTVRAEPVGGGTVRRFGPPLALVAILLGGWEVYARSSGVSPFVLPAPSQVLGALWDFRSEAIRHAIPTLVETLVGFSLSIAGATAMAVALDRVGWARRAVEPLLVGSQTVPIVAIAPLIVVWFGFGLLPKVLVVVLVTFFPITIALLDGFASTTAEATELLRSFGASAGQTFRKVRWPSGLPAFF